MNLIATLARLTKDHFSILFTRNNGRVIKSGFMLNRCVEFRPSARKMILSRCRNVTRAISAFRLESGISINMIFRRLSIMLIFFVVSKRCRRRKDLTFANNCASFNGFNERRTLHRKGTILCIRHYRVKINALLRMSKSITQATINNTQARVRRVFRAIGLILRQDSGKIGRHLNVNALMDHACQCNKEYGIQMLNSERNDRAGGSWSCCRSKGCH